MAVSIWEGSKAQDLIDAIKNTQKVDKQQGTESAGKVLIVGSDGLVVTGDAISSSVKTALLKCFRHVAWIDDHGQDYYDELEAALNSGLEPEPEPDPEWGTDYTWLYRADRDGVLSTNENITAVAQQGTPSETVSDNILNVQVANGAQIYKIDPITSSNAILKAKVRFNSLPSSTIPDGFRMQVSNGNTGAQIFAFKHSNSNVYSLRTSIGNTQSIVLDNIELDKWYVISCELRNGKQVLTVDNNETQYDSLADYACTESRVIVQGANGATDVDIAWVTFKDNDTV